MSSETIMKSLEWRIKKLEDKVMAQTGRLRSIEPPQQSIIDQLLNVAQFYEKHAQYFSRYIELYKACNIDSTLFGEMGSQDKMSIYRILVGEQELLEYFQNVEAMAEMAEKVLDVNKWPDLSGLDDKIGKLERTNDSQDLKSAALDNRVEELVAIYDDIIRSFKWNICSWNKQLEP